MSGRHAQIMCLVYVHNYCLVDVHNYCLVDVQNYSGMTSRVSLTSGRNAARVM